MLYHSLCFFSAFLISDIKVGSSSICLHETFVIGVNSSLLSLKSILLYPSHLFKISPFSNTIMLFLSVRVGLDVFLLIFFLFLNTLFVYPFFLNLLTPHIVH